MVGGVRSGLVAPVLLALSSACESPAARATAQGSPPMYVISNDLIAPVSIAIDKVPSIILLGGQSSGLAVSNGAQTLTWTSAKPLNANREQIPDDIGEIAIPLTLINRSIEITNVIKDQPYVTARIFNSTTAAVSVGVFDGTAVACAAELPGKIGTQSGFVITGYYRLLAATEMRAYRDPSCAGPYVSWSHSELTTFTPKSGTVTLTLSTAP